MPGISDKQLRSRSGWPAGIDNLSPEYALTADSKTGTPIALRVADNVDLDPATGKPRRRGGYASVHAGTRVHSLWREEPWPFALFVQAGTLRGMRADESVFDIQAGLEAGAPVSFALVGDRVFWTNGRRNGVVLVDGTPAPWGCQMPGGQPALEVAPAGALAVGTYQVAITYMLEGGEESGAHKAAVIDLPAGGGIALTQIQQPTEGGVAAVRVYASTANGDALYHAKDVPVGVTTAVIGAAPRGRPLDTQFLTRMPAGRYVRLHMGRLFVLQADGTLVWSEALRYGLTHPAHNRMRIADGGMLLEAVGQGTGGAGLFVGGRKRTYWMQGAPEAMSPTIASAHGAVPGTGLRVPGAAFGIEGDGEVAYWMGANGVAMIGTTGGAVAPQRANQVVAPQASGGASMYREHDGLRQVVTTLKTPRARALAMKDSTKVTVIRHDQG